MAISRARMLNVATIGYTNLICELRILQILSNSNPCSLLLKLYLTLPWVEGVQLPSNLMGKSPLFRASVLTHAASCMPKVIIRLYALTVSVMKLSPYVGKCERDLKNADVLKLLGEKVNGVNVMVCKHGITLYVNRPTTSALECAPVVHVRALVCVCF